MIVKTTELTGAALDWAVAKCEGFALHKDCMLNGELRTGWHISGRHSDRNYWIPLETYSPSTDWSQSGPIIDREWIELEKHWDVRVAFVRLDDISVYAYGPTSPIASMRAYVAAKIGDEIEVPDELLS